MQAVSVSNTHTHLVLQLALRIFPIIINEKVNVGCMWSIMPNKT